MNLPAFSPTSSSSLHAGTMEVKDFILEAQVMKSLQHPNLLQLYAVCTMMEPIYIVTELMKHGSLLEYLRQGEGQYIGSQEMIDMIAQISAGTRKRKWFWRVVYCAAVIKSIRTSSTDSQFKANFILLNVLCCSLSVEENKMSGTDCIKL